MRKMESHVEEFFGFIGHFETNLYFVIAFCYDGL